MLKWATALLVVAAMATLVWFQVPQKPAPQAGKSYGYPAPRGQQPEPMEHVELATEAAENEVGSANPREFELNVDSQPQRPDAQPNTQTVLHSPATSGLDSPASYVQRPPTLAEFGHQRLPTAPPPGEPEAIALPTPQARFVDNTREVRAWHDSVEREPTDPDWSDTMASRISNFFVGDNLPAGYKPVTAHCRAAICEVYAFAPEYGAYPRFGQALRKMRQQPWAETLGRSIAYHTYSDGNTTAMVFIERVAGQRPAGTP